MSRSVTNHLYGDRMMSNITQLPAHIYLTDHPALSVPREARKIERSDTPTCDFAEASGVHEQMVPRDSAVHRSDARSSRSRAVPARSQHRGGAVMTATYTAAQVAELMGVSEWVIYECVRRAQRGEDAGPIGTMAIRVGRRLVWPRAAIQRLLVVEEQQ